MSPRARKTLLVTLALLQVVFFAAFFAWRATAWHRGGWSGMSFLTEALSTPSTPASAEESAGEKIVVGNILSLHTDSPATRAGFRLGDYILSVNGIPLADSHEAELWTLDRSIQRGDTLHYEVIPTGTLEDDEVVPAGTATVIRELTLSTPFEAPEITFGAATSLLSCAAYLAISLLVFWARPRSRPAWIFYLMCTSAAWLFFAGAFSDLGIRNLRGVVPLERELFTLLSFAGFILIGIVLSALLLHLSLVFPHRTPILRRKPQLAAWIYWAEAIPMIAILGILGLSAVHRHLGWGILGPGLLLASILLALLGFLISRARQLRFGVLLRHPGLSSLVLSLLLMLPGLQIAVLPDQARQRALVAAILGAGSLLLMMALVYPVLTCIALYRGYRRSSVEEKHQVRWPLWGTLVSLLLATVLSMTLMLAMQRADWMREGIPLWVLLANEVVKLCYLIIPVSFAFGILKYRLLDIDVLIRRTLIYGSLTGFVILIYFMVVGVVGVALVTSTGIESQVVTVGSTLLVAGLMIPLRNRIQSFVDQRFFRREVSYGEVLRELRTQVSEAVDLDALLPTVVEQLQRALKPRSLAIFIRRPESGLLLPVAQLGISSSTLDGLSFESKSALLQPSQSAPRQESVLRWRQRDLPPAERSQLRRLGAHLVVLCRTGGQPVGLLTLGRRVNGEPYDDQDESFLSEVAAQLGLAIGNLGRRREELEVAQAYDIQRSLLPTTIPEVEGTEITALWRPAREVSGDYYDVLPLADGELAVCIGDVSGKGTPAALLMSSLQAAVKAVTPSYRQPREICTRARAVLTQNLASGKFITFFLAIFDPAQRRLRYTNCGHNPPILARRDGEVQRLAIGGPILAGLFASTPLKQDEIQLEPGDRLLLFTDGANEAHNSLGQELGEDRLEELLARHRSRSAAEIQQIVSEAVLEHAHSELGDDLTLVVLAVNE